MIYVSDLRGTVWPLLLTQMSPVEPFTWRIPGSASTVLPDHHDTLFSVITVTKVIASHRAWNRSHGPMSDARMRTSWEARRRCCTASAATSKGGRCSPLSVSYQLSSLIAFHDQRLILIVIN